MLSTSWPVPAPGNGTDVLCWDDKKVNSSVWAAKSVPRLAKIKDVRPSWVSDGGATG